jgi:hypothetical protein
MMSMFAQMDKLLPAEFGAVDAPTLRRTKSDIFLRCRPSELYLGVKTEQGVMEFYVFYDGNVYADDVVQDWLDFVCEAAVYYAGEV